MLPSFPSRPQVTFVSFLTFSPFMASGSIISIVSMVSWNARRAWRSRGALVTTEAIISMTTLAAVWGQSSRLWRLKNNEERNFREMVLKASKMLMGLNLLSESSPEDASEI